MTVSPITINLLAEEEQAAQARARDPFKLLIAISIWVLAVAVAVGGVLSGLALRNEVQMKRLEHNWQELEKQQTSRNVAAYRSLKQWADDMIKINQSRRLYAPQLALVKNLVPDTVQLARLSLATTTVAQSAPVAAQLMTLQLEGMVASGRPEEDMANFRHSLETDAALSAQIQQVQLRSYGRISSPTERGGSAIGQFVIECQYKEQTP